MRGNESQEINFTLTSMAAFWLFPQTGVLISGPCCWKKTVSVTDLSQNVEITSRKWFSDNSEQATLFFCCKSSLWKARRPVLTTPQHTLASWTAGEIKAGGVLSVPDVAGQPAPTEGPAGCCTDTILWAARSQWAWVLRLVQTGRRAWTQWVYREEAPSQVAFCRMHSCWRRGLFMHQAVCWEMDQRGWSSKFTAQNTCSALRMQRGLAATPTGPPIYTSFLQSTACPGAAFCCNCSKGLWERDTVSLRKTKRKVWILAQHHPWNNAPGFSNGKQGQ